MGPIILNNRLTRPRPPTEAEWGFESNSVSVFWPPYHAALQVILNTLGAYFEELAYCISTLTTSWAHVPASTLDWANVNFEILFLASQNFKVWKQTGRKPCKPLRVKKNKIKNPSEACGGEGQWRHLRLSESCMCLAAILLHLPSGQMLC